MRVLFDHGKPAPLIPFLAGHTVTKAKHRGWDTLSNGDLLTVAEEAGFDLLLTADKNIRYQQNLEGRRIARNPSVRPGHSAGEPTQRVLECWPILTLSVRVWGGARTRAQCHLVFL